jgi:hypothetical protein
MSGKRAPTKHKAKAGGAAKALPARKARSTVKARPTKVPPVLKLITPRDLEILEYAEAMGLFAKKQYQAAQPLFLRLTGAENIDIAHAARTRLQICEQLCAKPRI